MFKIGQKVICINNSNHPELILNKIYIIDEMYVCPGCGVLGLIFYSICEINNDGIRTCIICNSSVFPTYISYNTNRFRPLEYNTCHDELLKNIAIEKLDGKEIKVKEKV